MKKLLAMTGTALLLNAALADDVPWCWDDSRRSEPTPATADSQAADLGVLRSAAELDEGYGGLFPGFEYARFESLGFCFYTWRLTGMLLLVR